MLHAKHLKIAMACALLLLFAGIVIYSVINSDSGKQSSGNDLSQKKPLSTEPYLIIRFSSTTFVITSNPIETDSIIAITTGMINLESQCKTIWPPVQMVKNFPESGKTSHMYLVKTFESCYAGTEKDEFIEYMKS